MRDTPAIFTNFQMCFAILAGPIERKSSLDMRGIESAFFGVLGKDPELKTSKSGAAYATLAVVVGEDADSQWVRVACFGETAEQIAIRAKKGDKVYVEGTLTLNTWTDKTTGEERHGLNVAWISSRISEKRAFGPRRAKRKHSCSSAPRPEGLR